jgi:ABC-type Fe3+-hydroxamate transport system substrate-binding protein
MKITDDRGRELYFPVPPKRVVSLVPSDTLSVSDLGCASALVGRTDYCELPEDVVRGVPSVGGTKNPNLDKITEISPDLVIVNQEENTRRDIEELAKRGFRIYVAFPKRVAEGIAHLAKLARIFKVDRDPNVRALCKKAYDAHREAEAARKSQTPLRTFCPIWMDPLMTIHGTTFISDMLDLCGAQNVFADRERRYPLAADLGKRAPASSEKIVDRDTRYPRITMDEVVERAPELVLLPDEPHAFTEEDANVFRALAIPAAPEKILKCSGKDLCWYGSRSAEGITRLRTLIDSARENTA